MTDEHGRYEQLAVGHVLGGLKTSDAADFRSHLLRCHVCRTRVAELRDIATELEAAERDERARAQVRTELPRRADGADVEAAASGHDDGPVAAGLTRRHVAVAALLVLVMAGAMAFWNLHLRTTVAARTSVAEAHADTLRELATGVQLPAEFGAELTGLVVVDEERVALSLAGVNDVAPDEAIVAWLLDDAGEPTPATTLLAPAGPLDDGLVAGVLSLEGASRLVVTRETGTPGDEPVGPELVEADLRGPPLEDGA